MQDKVTWAMTHTVALLAVFIATPVIAFFLCYAGWLRAAWLVTAVLMTLFVVVVGLGVSGRASALFIDDRNKMSLSRFQAAVWTLLVLSAFLVAAFWNISHNTVEPLSIALPEELWLLMGISATSLAGSPLIRSTKRANKHDETELAQTKAQNEARGVPQEAVQVKGTLVTNADPAYARWSDMFSGEEVGNAARLDLSKIQMFYFTMILLAAYAAALWHGFDLAPVAKVEDFPAFDKSMLALLGISHTAYLANKAVPHSQTSA
jgi:hypothetical protein